MADRGHELVLELLHLLALGDVAHQPDETPTVVHGHLGDRQFHRKTTAVGTLADDFAADADDLAHPGSPIGTEVAVMLAGVGRGHQHLDVAPEHLLRAVAEQALGGQVEAFDKTLLVDGNDRIERVVEHRARACLGFAQLVGHGVGQRERARPRPGKRLQERENEGADQRTAGEYGSGGAFDRRRRVDGVDAQSPLSVGEVE
jgi:hypothetical protein